MLRVWWLLTLLGLALRSEGHTFLRHDDVSLGANTTLCGEPEAHHAGYLNGLFYVFYETRAAIRAPTDVPLVLWLSGGPGCSGMIAMLFEHGPCSVNQATPTTTLNPYSWTQAAHMIYVDQPRGTGMSPSRDASSSWTESSAMRDLVVFLEGFYQTYPAYAANDLYIFGESYGGHYVPDLAHAIVSSTNSNTRALRRNLKGIGIGNGLVSERAIADTIGAFASTAPGGKLTDSAASSVATCEAAIAACQSPEDGGVRDCSKTGICESLVGSILSQAHQQQINHYDIRAPCYPDVFGLCYKFTPLFQYMNKASTMEALGLNGGVSWAPCNQDVFELHMDADWYEESEYRVAELLEAGVRVLVYAGDYDLVCNWMAQDKWTRDMVWTHQAHFAAQPLALWSYDGDVVGERRSFGGLTMLRVYNAGHMVPFDQPKAALGLFRSFLAGN
ncbi:hypothetical protein SDRG_04993 [Saprolegnia diclina VS20]|uniref:Carboxypeptidase n=1 Tax=Saprolegnia diclina (strain VS20) TaxID=1156394 RepID=T0QHF9_SAPDV|nr:hypothetical protein SDRG_04993 [Saprolegnia diclina VS20]EQC37389.1 hypothetical protein SDRG_04993 [Saprolegnia diclina VS20]|eukprot:XP_008608909.1 hypothetical protein SDRG_04993 [Saprolegnia diclina VS20]